MSGRLERERATRSQREKLDEREIKERDRNSEYVTHREGGWERDRGSKGERQRV